MRLVHNAEIIASINSTVHVRRKWLQAPFYFCDP